MMLPLFKLENENFPIKVNYGESIYEMWGKVKARVRSWGDIELKNRTFPFVSGVRDFVCYYATLTREDDLWKKQEIFDEANIVPADMMQLFAFATHYMAREVNPEKPKPIVAAAEGSTWRCSHDCLHEMAGIYWNPRYHNRGPRLHTESATFQSGTRFLAIRQ